MTPHVDCSKHFNSSLLTSLNYDCPHIAGAERRMKVTFELWISKITLPFYQKCLVVVAWCLSVRIILLVYPKGHFFCKYRICLVHSELYEYANPHTLYACVQLFMYALSLIYRVLSVVIKTLCYMRFNIQRDIQAFRRLLVSFALYTTSLILTACNSAILMLSSNHSLPCFDFWWN